LKRIRWTPLAINDLKSISSYIKGQRNLATANRTCRVIYEAIQRLRRFPESGRFGMEEETRELVVPALPSYIVVYGVTEAIDIQTDHHAYRNMLVVSSYLGGRGSVPDFHTSQNSIEFRTKGNSVSRGPEAVCV
jgi:toxin ParE1/3/4